MVATALQLTTLVFAMRHMHRLVEDIKSNAFHANVMIASKIDTVNDTLMAEIIKLQIADLNREDEREAAGRGFGT